MAFTPQSIVHLLNVPIENDYKNQIYFADKGAQYTYFASRIVRTVDNVTYQRKDNVIRVPIHIDSLYDCNYVMYQNANFSNKWFYAFITKMEYINDGRTDIYIETDVYQTWLEEATLKTSFVEREHVTDDTIGKHLLMENLETGEYVSNAYATALTDEFSERCYVMGSTVDPDDTEADLNGNTYNGVFSGVTYFRYNTVASINSALAKLAKAGKSDAITGIFIVPHYLALTNVNESGVYEGKIQESVSAFTRTVSGVVAPSSLDGYTPKNKKLLTFPYCYMVMSNNNGSANVYQYEYFTNRSASFRVYSAICPGCSIRAVPINYKGASINHDEGLNLGKFPVCNFNVDMYTNWLTQNSLNNTMGIVSGAVKLAGGLVTTVSTGGIGAAAGVGMMASGFNDIMNVVKADYQHALVPDQVRGNTNCGDVITSSNTNCLHFYQMTIKAEFAKIIDNFFELYGYKVNTMKVPNTHARPHWNYVKTINVNISGTIPNDDMEKLKAMYNNGVTFWNKGSEVENYSLNNH